MVLSSILPSPNIDCIKKKYIYIIFTSMLHERIKRPWRCWGLDKWSNSLDSPKAKRLLQAWKDDKKKLLSLPPIVMPLRLFTFLFIFSSHPIPTNSQQLKVNAKRMVYIFIWQKLPTLYEETIFIWLNTHTPT